MAFLDALTILGAGVSRGYRQSQEMQRRIAEAKRKALLEEREQRIREREATSMAALRAAQIEDYLAGAGKTREETTGITEARRRALEPIGEGPLSLDILGNRIRLPSTRGSLLENEALIRELIGEAGTAKRHGEEYKYKREFPETKGKTPEEQAIQVLLDLVGPLSSLETLDPETAKAGLETRLNFILPRLPAKVRALLAPSDTSRVNRDPLGIR